MYIAVCLVFFTYMMTWSLSYVSTRFYNIGTIHIWGLKWGKMFWAFSSFPGFYSLDTANTSPPSAVVSTKNVPTHSLPNVSWRAAWAPVENHWYKKISIILKTSTVSRVLVYSPILPVDEHFVTIRSNTALTILTIMLCYLC